MPITASIEPIDRSMLRVTMTSTIPVVMIPTTAVCTDRFHRFRGDRNVPPDQMSNTIQMTASAMSIPNSRGSSSIERSTAEAPLRLLGSPCSTGAATVDASLKEHPPFVVLCGAGEPWSASTAQIDLRAGHR